MSLIIVGTADLRRALQAAGPHASTDTDDTTCHRVRLAVGEHNITVSATNRYSAALALVSIEEHDGEVIDIDLSSQDVKEILALFKSTKAGTDEEIGDVLQLRTTDEHFRVTDVSGLFPGKSLSLPRLAVDGQFPDVAAIAFKALTRPPTLSLEIAERLTTAGTLLALFKSAAAAYNEPLALEMTGPGSVLVVSCGESFLGLLKAMKPNDDQLAEMTRWRDAWLTRLEASQLVNA